MAALIIEDPEQTYLVALRPGETLVVGRGPDCDLPITAERASRRHAEVRPDGDGHAIVDLDSTNGTRLNGQALTAAHRLADGDVLDVGGAVLRYRGGPTA